MVLKGVHHSWLRDSDIPIFWVRHLNDDVCVFGCTLAVSTYRCILLGILRSKAYS